MKKRKKVVSKKRTPIHLWWRSQREGLGLTQSQAAVILGYDNYQYLSNVDRGVAPLPKKWIKPISMLTKFPQHILLDWWFEDRRKREMKKFQEKFETKKLKRK